MVLGVVGRVNGVWVVGENVGVVLAVDAVADVAGIVEPGARVGAVIVVGAVLGRVGVKFRLAGFAGDVLANAGVESAMLLFTLLPPMMEPILWLPNAFVEKLS
jgi:hypothetical protein